MAASERPKKFTGTVGTPSPGLPGRPPSRPAPSRSEEVDAPHAEPAVGSTLPLEGLLDGKALEMDSATLSKLTSKGGKALEKAQEKAHNNALQVAHALQLMAPGVLAVMTHPGVGSSEAEQAGALVDWFESVRSKAAAWVEAWGLEEEDKPWAQAALERLVAEYPALPEGPVISRLLELARTHTPPPPLPYMPLQAAASLALFEGLAAVQRAQVRHGLGRRSIDEDLESVARLLVESGTDALAELLDPATSGEVRVAIFAAAVTQAGRTLEALWDAYARTQLASWRLKSGPEQELWKKANPEGVPLEPLFQQFQEANARIRRLARAARVRH